MVSCQLFQKREKRRWLFRKPAAAVAENATLQAAQQPKMTNVGGSTEALVSDQRHAVVLAVAAAAAAEVARLSRPTTGYSREHYAAIIIQTAFRGYLVSMMFRFVCWVS